MSDPNAFSAKPKASNGFSYCAGAGGNCYVGSDGDGWYSVRFGRNDNGDQCWYENVYMVDSSVTYHPARNIPCTPAEFCKPDKGWKTCWVKYQGALSNADPAIPMEPFEEPIAAPYTVSLGSEDLVVIALAILALVNLVVLVYKCCYSRVRKMAKVGGKVHVYQKVRKPINASDTDLDESL